MLKLMLLITAVMLMSCASEDDGKKCYQWKRQLGYKRPMRGHWRCVDYR